MATVWTRQPCSVSTNTLHRFLPSPGGPSQITLRYRSLSEAASQTLQLIPGVCKEMLQVFAQPRRREAAVMLDICVCHNMEQTGPLVRAWALVLHTPLSGKYLPRTWKF